MILAPISVPEMILVHEGYKVWLWRWSWQTNDPWLTLIALLRSIIKEQHIQVNVFHDDVAWQRMLEQT